VFGSLFVMGNRLWVLGACLVLAVGVLPWLLRDLASGGRLPAPTSPSRAEERTKRAAVERSAAVTPDGPATEEPVGTAWTEDATVLDRVRARYAETLDAWLAEVVEAQEADHLGTAWLEEALGELDGELAPRDPFRLSLEDFSALDEFSRGAIGDYLQEGLSWWRRTEGEDGGLDAERFRAYLRDDGLALPPEMALTALGVDPDSLQDDDGMLADLARTRQRLLVLAAPSLALGYAFELHALSVLEAEGIQGADRFRELTLVAPDLVLHRQAVVDLNREYYELLLLVAGELGGE